MSFVEVSYEFGNEFSNFKIIQNLKIHFNTQISPTEASSLDQIKMTEFWLDYD